MTTTDNPQACARRRGATRHHPKAAPGGRRPISCTNCKCTRSNWRCRTSTLRQTQAALEAARDRYLDLYEFAPTGYLTLSAEGIIVAINLTGVETAGPGAHRLVAASLSWPAWRRRIGMPGCSSFQHFKKQAAPLRVELALQRGDGAAVSGAAGLCSANNQRWRDDGAGVICRHQ
jgi:hypothetical protein